jgi:hypothetical protein
MPATETTEITFELNTPTGPRVDYGDHSPEEIAAVLPEGWEPDYSSQIKLANGQFRAPLVRA